jgi:hypothetical protein
MAALALVFGMVLDGCDNGSGSGEPETQPVEILRYETVPVSSRGSGQESSVLANLARSADSTTYYYLYYLGYVTNVPVAYKTAYYYNGTTPITITFEKNWVTEDTITQSTTKTKEETTTWNWGGTVTVGVEAEAGAIFAKAKVTGSVSASASYELAQALSTSNTLETARMKAEGESESISATIGDHGEAPGTYRYALFGTTDVYCLFEVDPATRAIRGIQYETCARESSYAWGIDFDPAAIPKFGKTGGGDLLEIPDIDFTTVAAPTDTLEGPPAPPPELKTVYPATSASDGGIVTDDRVVDDYWVTDFDVDRLIDEGYTFFEGRIDFWAQEIDDGYINIFVYKNSISDANLVGKTYDTIDLPNTAWNRESFTFTMPIRNFTNKLYIAFDASGKGEDDYRLDERTITVTAKK